MTAKRLSAASYRAMGEQSPIEFECEDGSVVKIPRPTAGVMFDVEESQRLGTAGPPFAAASNAACGVPPTAK